MREHSTRHHDARGRRVTGLAGGLAGRAGAPGLVCALVCALGLLATACGKGEGNEASGNTAGTAAGQTAGQTATQTTTRTTTTTAGDQAQKTKQKAWQYYMINCRQCHGDTGRGDGPNAINASPKPRDYSDPTWQNETTDDQIKEILIKGGLALGKSALMQPRPELERKTELLDALVAIIRGFGKGEGPPR